MYTKVNAPFGNDVIWTAFCGNDLIMINEGEIRVLIGDEMAIEAAKSGDPITPKEFEEELIKLNSRSAIFHYAGVMDETDKLELLDKLQLNGHTSE